MFARFAHATSEDRWKRRHQQRDNLGEADVIDPTEIAGRLERQRDRSVIGTVRLGLLGQLSAEHLQLGGRLARREASA